MAGAAVTSEGRERARGRTLPSLWTLAGLAVIGVALAVRLIGLGSPGEMLVDERYYVDGARSLLERGWEPTTASPVPGGTPAVHPPLGKWLIAAGIAVAGDRPLGWRLAGALAGTVTVALVWLTARRLFRDEAAALIAAGLLAVEHLSVVQSRTAMLDVFVALWVVAGLWALAIDRDAPLPEGRRRRHPWRIAAGVVLGCALATKWSGAYVLPFAAGLTAWWEYRRRLDRGDDRRTAAEGTLWGEGPSIIAAFALIPVAVYVASSAGAFVTGAVTPLSWWQDQLRVLDFHANLAAGHPYASSALSWLADRRPVAYFYAKPQVGGVPGASEVLAVGHPLVFFGIVPVWVWATFEWARGRGAALVWPLLFSIALWVPWVTQDRAMFIFYMTPVVPFIVLLQGAALAKLLRSGPGGAVLATVLLLGVVALFWFHWPVLTGAAITQQEWAVRVADWSRIPFWRPNWV